MTRRETPIEWLELLEAKRLHSIRDLAAALDVSPQTAVRLVHGEQTSRQTIEKAAELLGVPTERIHEMRHETPLPPFRLPPEADKLSPKQRAVLVDLARTLAEQEPSDAEIPTTSASSVEDAIRNDPKLLPEARRHLLNQYGLLLRIRSEAEQAARAQMEAEERRQLDRIGRADLKLAREIESNTRATKDPRKGHP